MKYTISSPQYDNYQIYASERECYAIRSTGNLYLRAMVPYRYQAPQSRTGSFNRDDMDPAYGNLDYLKKPHPKEKLTCDRAAIIYFEGSGFMGVENFNGYPTFTDIVRENIVFICCDYRGAGLDDERFPCNIEDAKEAIRYVRKNAARFGIDENRIFVMGCSSGGYTATMAGITSEDEFIYGDNKDISNKVAGIIDCFGTHRFR